MLDGVVTGGGGGDGRRWQMAKGRETSGRRRIEAFELDTYGYRCSVCMTGLARLRLGLKIQIF
jgi:hypothetical protein